MSLTNAHPIDAAKAAKAASHVLATLPANSRNDALTAIHRALTKEKDIILAANARDLVSAKEAVDNGQLNMSIVSRLDLGRKGKWEDMLKGILDVRDLEDPGELWLWISLEEIVIDLSQLDKLPYELVLTMDWIWRGSRAPSGYS
jgi:glutamate-5-semialdehyde dehydrogenase